MQTKLMEHQSGLISPDGRLARRKTGKRLGHLAVFMGCGDQAEVLVGTIRESIGQLGRRGRRLSSFVGDRGGRYIFFYIKCSSKLFSSFEQERG
jgi:hypothetical protein